MYFKTIDLETIVLVIIVSIVILLITTYFELRKKPKKPEYETKEMLECIKCKYRLIQDFEPGDFVSMYKSNCPKCGERMKIKAIFNVERTLKRF